MEPVPRKPTPKASNHRKPAPLNPDDWLDEPLDGPEEAGGASESHSGIVVTKMKLSTITGLAAVTLDKAFAAGAPVIAKGNRKQGWQINTAAFFAWYTRWKIDSVAGTAGKVDFETAKTRKAVADAERVEMSNERIRSNTITIDEAVAVYREEATVIRSQLMAIPGRVATMGHAAKTPLELEMLVRDEIDIALQNLTSDSHEAWKEHAAATTGNTDDTESV